MRAIGIILAGGNSERLKDLCKVRAIAAMPVVSSYRAIDFSLSNMSNSGIKKVAVITQFNSRSLQDHLSSAKWWELDRKEGGLYIFTPFLSSDNNFWFRGIADSIYQNISYLKRSHEPYVVICSGEAVYKMDYSEVLQYHIDKAADLTIVYKNVSRTNKDVHDYGVMTFGENNKLETFEEKPIDAKSSNISLGIYVIKRTLLIKLLENAIPKGYYDFVKDIILRNKDKIDIYGYEFDGIYQYDDFYTDTNGNLVLKPGITNNTRYNTGEKGAQNGAVPGAVKYKDQDGDGDITTNDRTVIGNAMPKWFGGITNTFEYKGFDLSFMFQFNYGNDIYNATRLYATQSRSGRRNMLAEVADRWSPTNASNLVPSYRGYITNDVYSRFVEDGSFLRLKNVTLGYTLPKKWTNKFHASRLRVYVTGQNLFCLNNYSGYDPEVNSLSNPMMPGLDWGAYPKSRVFTVGIDLQF